MKCIIKKEDNNSSKGLIIKRRFIPIRFTVDHKGQYLNIGTKLPFTSNKVIGVLPTTKVTPCSEEPYPTLHYYGVSDTQMTDTRFLSENPGIQYDTPYPPDVNSEGEPGKWWYYVHPILEETPFWLTDNMGFRRLENPVNLEIKHPGQCVEDYYFLWSRQVTDKRRVVISFFPET